MLVRRSWSDHHEPRATNHGHGFFINALSRSCGNASTFLPFGPVIVSAATRAFTTGLWSLVFGP